MKKYQIFLNHLSQSGEIVKNSDGKIGLSLPSYTLEYKFEKRGKKICGNPPTDGLPLVLECPKLIFNEFISDVHSLAINDFEEFNRTLQNFRATRKVFGHLRLGKTISLPFLKQPGDFRVPSCKIIEEQSFDYNKFGSVNLEISLHNHDVIQQLPKLLDTITIFYAALCILSNFTPNKIIFTLIRPFCEDKEIGNLETYTEKFHTFKAMRIKPGITNMLSMKQSDIEFAF